ncbi:MAG: PD-(D/E)XK nuclease family protein, partial [Gemmatimonadetes bacterium]|nr:PD-(D/E)XK nuclease family protein [Gemmatimonadota bacterium]
FQDRALELLEDRARRARIDLPPPSEAVFRAEMASLRADVRSFCTQLATEGLTPDAVIATEMELGGATPVAVELPGGGAIRLAGRADRVDRTADGTRVVDYKTGSTWGHGAKEGAYNGGRRLQHVLYARALEAQRPDLEPVAGVEYHFPTVRGENAVHAYDAARLADGLDLVRELADLAAAGSFPATDDPSDCRFCDYAAVCRFGRTRGEKGEESAPRVEWTRGRMADGAEPVQPLRRVRTHGADR